MKDLTGNRYGKLTVIRYSHTEKNYTFWECKCDCGNTKIVRSNNLTQGGVKSCGCLRHESHIKHGGSRTRLYHIWVGMRRRCEDEHRKEFKDYGARGIKVCDDWKDNYSAFQNWAIENGYDDDLSIDRIDIDGNYEPSNCRWVNKTWQENNKRHNVLITANGKTQTAAEWSREIGISAVQLRKRKRAGWSDDDIINKPLDQRMQRFT